MTALLSFALGFAVGVVTTGWLLLSTAAGLAEQAEETQEEVDLG